MRVQTKPTIVSVPVKLTQAIRFHKDKCTGEQRRDGEVRGRVLNLYPSSAARRNLLLLLVEVEDEGRRHVPVGVRDGLVARVPERRRCYCALEDVRVLLRDAAQERNRAILKRKWDGGQIEHDHRYASRPNCQLHSHNLRASSQHG